MLKWKIKIEEVKTQERSWECSSRRDAAIQNRKRPAKNNSCVWMNSPRNILKIKKKSILDSLDILILILHLWRP